MTVTELSHEVREPQDAMDSLLAGVGRRQEGTSLPSFLPPSLRHAITRAKTFDGFGHYPPFVELGMGGRLCTTV